MSGRLRVATLQRYGGNEVAFVTRFLMNVFNEPADFCGNYCDVEENWGYSDMGDVKWTKRDK